MSDQKSKSLQVRRTIVRAVLIAVYVGVIALAYVLGKGHTILVDNKDVESAQLQAFDDVVVGVDNQETTELTSGDRDMFKVTGQRHRITLEIMGRDDKVQKEIVLPLGQDMILVSLPKLVAGIEPYMEPFKPVETTVVPDRSSEDFTTDSAGVTTATDVPAGPDSVPSPATMAPEATMAPGATAPSP